MSLSVSPCPELRLEVALTFPIVLFIRLELSLGENVAQQRQGSWGLAAQPQPRTSYRPSVVSNEGVGEDKDWDVCQQAEALSLGPRSGLYI